MFTKVFVFVNLCVIQVTRGQCLNQDFTRHNGLPNEEISPNKRCARQAKLPDGMAVNDNSLRNGMQAGNMQFTENKLSNDLANLVQNMNNLPTNVNNLPANMAFNFPANMALQNLNYVPINKMMPNINANGLPNMNNMPINNGVPNTNNILYGNGIGNGMPIGNNLPINNFVPNNINGPLINGFQNLNNLPVNNGFLNTNYNNWPNINNMPGANGLPNNFVPSNPVFTNLPGPYNLPNANNFPVNNFMPNGNNILPTNALPYLPQNIMPVNSGLPNALNLPIANDMPNMNYLPNANTVPMFNNMPCGGPNINNFAMPNGMANNNFLPSNAFPFANNNMQMNSMALIGLELCNNNPFTINSNMPLHSIVPIMNNLPVNGMSSTVSFLNGINNNNGRFVTEGLFTGMPNNNLPVTNNFPARQNILQNGFPINLQPQNQPSLTNNLNLPNSLQIEGFGNLPLLNGLPVAGITETVTLLNSPCG